VRHSKGGVRAGVWMLAIILGAPVFQAAAVQPPVAAGFTSLAPAPIYFEARGGQGGQIFFGRGPDCNLIITPSDATLVFGARDSAAPVRSLDRALAPDREFAVAHAISLRWQGTSPDAVFGGLDRMASHANYIIGNNPSGWLPGVPLFRRVSVSGVYPGVELIYYANASALEYDFVLQPGAAPGQIRFSVEGADSVGIDANGNLVLKAGSNEVREHAPVIYQVDAAGARKIVSGGYQLLGPALVGFHVGAYDPSLPLIIDPTFDYGTFLGGRLHDRGWGVAVSRDGSGSIFVCGETLSPDFVTNDLALAGISDFGFTNLYQGGTKFFGDAFVAKFNSSMQLQFLTYLGGNGQDGAFAIASDSSGNAYVAGFTDSDDFPVTNAFQSVLAGPTNNPRHIHAIDAFVAELNGADGTVMNSTFLGGNGRDTATGIALDATDGVYVTGYTESTNFAPTNITFLQGLYVVATGRTNLPKNNSPFYYLTNYAGNIYQGNGDAYIAKLSPDLATLDYWSYLGGTNQDEAEGIAVDGSGVAYVAGITSSTNFPIFNPFLPTAGVLNTQTNRSPGVDGFISAVAISGPSLVLNYSTFLGGSNDDGALHVAVTPGGDAFVSGFTSSTNFPAVRIHSSLSRTNFNQDAFVVGLDPAGNETFSAIFGGEFAEQATAIDVDPATENIFVTGFSSSSTNFHGVKSLDTAEFFTANTSGVLAATNTSIRKFGTNDIIVMQLSTTNVPVSDTNFLFSAYLGGDGNDEANGIAFDSATMNVYIVGSTTSSNFPGFGPPLQPNIGSGHKKTDAFIGRIHFP
jgi:hypothetical protein